MPLIIMDKHGEVIMRELNDSGVKIISVEVLHNEASFVIRMDKFKEYRKAALKIIEKMGIPEIAIASESN